MNQSQFFDHCYGVYVHEREEADRLYARFPIAITMNVVLGGIVVYITRGDLISLFFTRIDVFLYYVGCAVGSALLILSSACLAKSIQPRNYAREALPRHWSERARRYERTLRDTDYKYSKKQIRKIVEKDLRDSLQTHVENAVAINREVNKERMEWFNKGLRYSARALWPILVQGAFGIAISLQS